MHHWVCSTVSVSTEHSQEVVPFPAKNREIFSRSSAEAPFTSTPTAPWVCTSMKPGTTRLPDRSTTSAPAGTAASASSTWSLPPLSRRVFFSNRRPMYARPLTI